MRRFLSWKGKNKMNDLKINLIKKAIEDKKGENIEVYDVSSYSPFFTHVVIATIINKKSGEAIADEIDRVLASIDQPIKNIEGKRDSEWILIDAQDVLVHLMTESERIRINLEQLIRKNVQEL